MTGELYRKCKQKRRAKEKKQEKIKGEKNAVEKQIHKRI